VGSPDIEDYPLVRVRWEGEYAQGHRALISAERADHIAIKGRGYIYGPPLSVSRLRNPRGPALIELSECKDVTLEGFTTQYQQLWSIHSVLCQKLVASNLTIRSVSFNGDGIDIDSCQDVLIEHCNIDTGDDAIALKSGDLSKTLERLLGRPPRITLKFGEVAAAPAADSAAVLQAVNAWAGAWSARDLDGYVAAYTKSFAPQGKSRAEWEAARRASFPAAKAVRVEIEQPQVSMIDGNQAQVTFRQRYHSARASLNTKKLLLLAREDGAWHITQERILP
jgi:ketosteroid isomerase-like protein